MNEQISKLLKEYGLNESEIKAYSYLVGKKQTTAYKIAKEIKIHKSTCYDILERLIEKGFVSKTQIKNKNYYLTNDISKVLGRIKTKEAVLQALIPEINKLESAEETQVKLSDSPGSYQEIDTKIYELAKNGKISFVYLLGNGPNLATAGAMILVEKIVKELAKTKQMKKINAKGIWDKRFRNDKFMKQFDILGENKFLDYLPTKVTTIIFDNHVAFLYFTNNDNVIEIKSKQIADEMKVYFEYLWKIAKK